MKTYAYIVTMCFLMLALFVGGVVVMEKGGPTSKLPEDRYYFYSRRAAELKDEDPEASKMAATSANIYHDEYNRQLAIRLSRALAITGDPKLFHQAYNAQKL